MLQNFEALGLASTAKSSVAAEVAAACRQLAEEQESALPLHLPRSSHAGTPQPASSGSRVNGHEIAARSPFFILRRSG